jgi:hypothetical protein
MELKGTILKVGKTQKMSDKFGKRDFVLTTNDNPTYPQHITLQCTNDKVVMLDNLSVGSEVTAHINLRGREWKNPEGEVKYFNTIECWKLDVTGEVVTAPKVKEEDFENLPF